MELGVELWNRSDAGHSDEWKRLRALGTQVVKVRGYHPPAMVRALAEEGMLILVRRNADGLIDPAGQVEEIRDVLAAVQDGRGRAIYILSNEDNHTASPYRQLGIERYRRDLGELVLALESAYPGLELAAPPMAVHADDPEWLSALEPDFYMMGLEHRCAHLYWQYGNYASPDWGRRLEQYAAISPGVSWIVDELGDSTPGKPSAEKAIAIVDVLRYLRGRGDVEAACLFLAAGGTTDWAEYVLPAEQLTWIREQMSLPLVMGVA